jgi:hypothetical protein
MRNILKRRTTLPLPLEAKIVPATLIFSSRRDQTTPQEDPLIRLTLLVRELRVVTTGLVASIIKAQFGIAFEKGMAQGDLLLHIFDVQVPATFICGFPPANPSFRAASFEHHHVFLAERNLGTLG